MKRWQEQLRVEPVPVLLESGDTLIGYLARRDLLEEDVEPICRLWSAGDAQAIIRKQQSNGSWEYPGHGKLRIRTTEDYNQIETYRRLGQLVEKHGFDRRHHAIEAAAEFLFSCQTDEGDFRGIYGRQYSPNYSAAIMELLIKAGYAKDRRIDAGFRWLLSMRQDDGGWAIPLRTVERRFDDPQTQQPDRSRPFSHLITGIVLRAFAAHPEHRSDKEAMAAAELLATRFFMRDTYSDRSSADFWERVSFPFWFTDVVSALDSISLIGLPRGSSHVDGALRWLAGRQESSGLFALKLLRTADRSLKYWVALAVCRVLKRLDSRPVLR